MLFINYFFGEVVTEFSNRPGFNVACIILASTGFHTVLCALCGGRYRPFVPVVTCGFNDVTLILIAALCAGVGRITVCLARRSGHDCLIIMLADFRCFICFNRQRGTNTVVRAVDVAHGVPYHSVVVDVARIMVGGAGGTKTPIGATI